MRRAVIAMRTEAMRVALDRIRTPLVHRNHTDFAAIVTRDAARMQAMIAEGGSRAAD